MAGDQLKLGQLLVERPAADAVVPALPQHRLDFSPRHHGQQVDAAIGSLRSQGSPGEWHLGALPAEYFDLYPAGRLRTLRFLAGTGRPERLPDAGCCPRRHCPQMYGSLLSAGRSPAELAGRDAFSLTSRRRDHVRVREARTAHLF